MFLYTYNLLLAFVILLIFILLKSFWYKPTQMNWFISSFWINRVAKNSCNLSGDAVKSQNKIAYTKVSISLINLFAKNLIRFITANFNGSF